MDSLSAFDAPVWRLIPDDLAERPAHPARAPEGRFHHSGQIAAYASLSADGAAVAIARYLGDGVRRHLVPMRLTCALVADVRGDPAASMVWQDIRETGAPSPTWSFSDKARAMGAEAMLYSSRSRPELSHVVVFDVSRLRCVGPITPFRS